MFGFPRNAVCSDGVCCCITIVCYTEFIVSSDTCLEFIEKTNRKFIEREKIKTMLKLIFKNLGTSASQRLVAGGVDFS